MSTVHRYYIPTTREPYDSWSVWLLDEATQTLIVFGDYGTWDYTWYPDGIDFRLKLRGFDRWYIQNKLSVGRKEDVDVDASVERVKKLIIQMRKDKDLSPDDAREQWDVLEDISEEFEWTGFASQYDYLEETVLRLENLGWIEHLMESHWPKVLEMMKADLIKDGLLKE